MAVIDKVSLLDNFWPVTGGGRMQGQFAFSSHLFKRSLLHSRWILEFFVFLEQMCYVQPLELRIHRISRTSVQSTAARFANSSYFSNTCAKCSRWISEFVVFREHVWKVQQPDVEFVVFFEHMRKVQPASKPDRSRFWTSGFLVWGAVRLIHDCN